MKVEIRKSAEADIRRVVRFYDSQREGLSDKFLDCFSKTIDLLEITAGIHSKYNGLHRCRIDRFRTFGVFYVVREGVANIVAVLDTREDPSSISNRLRSAVDELDGQ